MNTWTQRELENIIDEVEELANEVDKEVIGNYKDVLKNTKIAVKYLSELFEDESFDIEKSSGGNTGYGCSIMIKLGNEVICKISDHDKYKNSLAFVYDYMSEQKIKDEIDSYSYEINELIEEYNS